MPSSLGTKIKFARKDASLSPEALAVAIGVSGATLARIERGATDVKVQRLELIARATGKPIGWFLNGDKEEAA